MISLNNLTIEKTYAVGIDVGGSSLKCGVVDHEGEIVFSIIVSLANAKTEAEVFNLILEAIETCVGQNYQPICGVGIGFPGVIDDNVVIGGADNLPGFDQFPLGEILNELTGIPVIVDNDANLMGLGELTYGAAKYCGDAIFLTVGTGIGGAVLINHQLHGGFKNRGAELGHIVVQHDGLRCACGGKGCLEAYASVTALLKNYSRLNPTAQHVDGRYVIEKYLANEVAAIQAMEMHFDYLASGIISFINIFSPQKVVIGGGISESGQFYIDELTKRVSRFVIPVTASNTEIVAANLGNKAGVLGCAALVFQNFKPVDRATQ